MVAQNWPDIEAFVSERISESAALGGPLKFSMNGKAFCTRFNLPVPCIPLLRKWNKAAENPFSIIRAGDFSMNDEENTIVFIR